MKKEDYVVGKWYKNLSDGWIGKFEGYKTNQWWGSEWITENNEYDFCEGWIETTEDTCECLLSEIYTYLLDGHPDKIKPIDDLEPLLKLLKKYNEK